MHVYGPNNIHGPQPINPPHRLGTAKPTHPVSQVNTADELDISQEAQIASQARESGDIRADLVARLRQEIAQGTYDTDEKLNLALNRMFDEIF